LCAFKAHENTPEFTDNWQQRALSCLISGVPSSSFGLLTDPTGLSWLMDLPTTHCYLAPEFSPTSYFEWEHNLESLAQAGVKNILLAPTIGPNTTHRWAYHQIQELITMAHVLCSQSSISIIIPTTSNYKTRRAISLYWIMGQKLARWAKRLHIHPIKIFSKNLTLGTLNNSVIAKRALAHVVTQLLEVYAH
jgi:hypothetical protein